MATSFKTWIKAMKVTDDPIGDFIYDARRDKQFPKEIVSQDQLETYLMLRGACTEAIETVPEVWQRYQAWATQVPPTSSTLARRRLG